MFGHVFGLPAAIARTVRGWLRATADGSGAAHSPAVDATVLALLDDPAYELIPGTAAGQAVAALPERALTTVTCSPRGQIPATLALTAELARAGHRVVPHVAARLVSGPEMLAEIAATLIEHDITDVFVIAGDAPDAHGPYVGALDLIPDLREVAPGIARVGVAGYPDGHPLLDGAALRHQLLAKQALLVDAGRAGWVSTQMCFDPPRIRAWIEGERAAGLELPIRLGVPGVVDRARLVRIGARLGVGASLRYASKQGGTIARLIAPGGYDPLHVLVPLAADAPRLGIEGVHVFTFNSVGETVAWRQAIADD